MSEYASEIEFFEWLWNYLDREEREEFVELFEEETDKFMPPNFAE